MCVRVLLPVQKASQSSEQNSPLCGRVCVHVPEWKGVCVHVPEWKGVYVCSVCVCVCVCART